ncbi:polysaccharide deacetylase family protein [Paenibacillus sp. MMS20-IR301]|uniref:polysaccharide deacetylase family protein n=1 Tax=Paenibacillus sp. MMS20-IR301 TaxID=2895946 RepID=UPI0028E89227|nr:polysaccharide deacetylase family protein [Paenibacillus sp. MMS20-IR301]WNS41254.1 polysaccharide deacetylase family protein [Paenibacillus sp. MMS20-IR301]
MKKRIRITAAALAAFTLMCGSADAALSSPDRAKNRYYYEERGDMIWEVQTSQKVIALTFDDGPDPFETEGILEVLRRYDAKCTFFAIGKRIAAYPDVARHVIAGGHELANHTYNHVYFKTPIISKQIQEELELTEKEIIKVSGKHSSLFRPPGGMYDETLIDVSNSMGLKPVLWSWHQDTKDWNRPGVWSISSRVIRNARNGDIVLFHDHVHGESQTKEALEIILPELAKQGFRFVTVSELIGYSDAEQAETGRHPAN